ncbi:MAG: hypothetical protein QM753_18430 [Thermomicrobiales bacterium]
MSAEGDQAHGTDPFIPSGRDLPAAGETRGGGGAGAQTDAPAVQTPAAVVSRPADVRQRPPRIFYRKQKLQGACWEYEIAGGWLKVPFRR